MGYFICLWKNNKNYKKNLSSPLYHTISIYDFLRPKVAINVELYLATAMNYYFHAVIGPQFTKYL